jgi:hypothetical protein
MWPQILFVEGWHPMTKYLTSKENLALDLIFLCVGEERFNRTMKEYEATMAKLPSIKQLHGYINDRLKDLADRGFAPYQICHFKAGDRYPRYEEFPTSISLETVRSALVKSGMRTKGPRKPRTP